MQTRDRILQQATERIQRPDCRILAVELPVLLPLPLWEARDLYALLEPDVRRLAKLSGPIDFPSLREMGKGDRLESIYDDLSARILGGNIRPLAAKERELRLRLPVLMEDVNALLRLAKRLGKRTILYTGWPHLLTDGEVRQMLIDRQADLPDDVCNEHWNGCMQATGTLLLTAEPGRSTRWRLTVPSRVDEVRKERTPNEALRFLGYRTMAAVAALHPGRERVDPIAYGAFGMYLLSNAMWLVDETCRAGFDRVNFLARDGFLVKTAFEQVCAALSLPVETGYVRISRQAAFPLHFRRENDLLSLPLLTDVTAHTPRTLLSLFAPVVDMEQAAAVLSECGFLPDAPFDQAGIDRFIEVFRTHLYEEKRFAAYRAYAKAYLAPMFEGRCATYDVGYNLRSESVIADVTGTSLTAFITHTDSDLADRRRVTYRTLYPASPYVSWVAREQFLLEAAPACVAYDANGPVLAKPTPVDHAVTAFQEDALRFVADMVGLFGPLMEHLPFRPADGCMPFEAFLHRGQRRTLEPFRRGEVENAFLTGVKPGDSTYLQWRLMQTDFLAAQKDEPVWVTKLRRALLRLSVAPASLGEKLMPGRKS